MSTTTSAPSSVTPKETQKYSKDIPEKKLILELEVLTDSLYITIINNKKMVPVLFASEYLLDDIKNKDESLSLFQSIDKVFTFFSKLIQKDKFKIEEKDNLVLCYEDKMEDIEISFDIIKKEIDVKEENKNIKNYINEIKDDVDNMKQLSNSIVVDNKNLKNYINEIKNDIINIKKLSNLIEDDTEEVIPPFTKEIEDKKINIDLIQEKNCIYIKVSDNNGIVTFVYILKLTLEKMREMNK